MHRAGPEAAGMSPGDTLRQRRKEAARHPEDFWARAAQDLPWFRTWDDVFEWTFPTFRWFIGAETNLAYNALDHHVGTGRGNHVALVHVDECGLRSTYTYARLLDAVIRAAASLRRLGIHRGDRVTIYMPTCPEAIILMLASVRIGAIHSVVFAGFGASALRDRIVASGSRLVFTTARTRRRGRDIDLRASVEAALETPGHTVEQIVVLERGAPPGSPGSPDDIGWDEFLRRGHGCSGAHVRMEANETAFLLATSGTTARPKLTVHTHGGYQVQIVTMARWCFGLKPEDVWWTTGDIGWIVGHSFAVYAPLLIGCTSVLYEGALDYPEPGASWKTIVEGLGATGVFTSPTALRMLMRNGEESLSGIDHTRLERVLCAGEVLDPSVWEWMHRRALDGLTPVVDHMGQTEAGGPLIGNPYGLDMLPIKPGSSALPLPGIEAEVVRPNGARCRPHEKGVLVVKRPFPGLTPALWGEPERYADDYWRRVPNVYYTGDWAYVDEDGYYWFTGRADETISVAAHRLGTVEIERAFQTHPAVAECAVVGRPHDTRGEVISAFVLLKAGEVESAALKRELLETVRRELGPVAVIGDLTFITTLPRTRSGKILRRVLRAIVLERDPGDITTIDDETSIEEVRVVWRAMRGEAAL
jgi:acetyl-CoA synthetase